MGSNTPIVVRIRGEYREMPDLRLTVAQACRLWQLDAAVCAQVLEYLVDTGFLAQTPEGAFVTR